MLRRLAIAARWGKIVHDVLQPIAILAAGIWAYYTFRREKIIDPAAEPANVIIESKLTQVTAQRQDDLVPIIVEIRLKNPSTVRSYVPLTRWRLIGSAVRAKAFDRAAFNESAAQTFQSAGTSLMLAHGTFSGTDAYQPVSTGTVFPGTGYWLDSKEEYLRTTVVFVPSTMERLRLITDIWTCRDTANWRFRWDVDPKANPTEPEFVSPTFIQLGTFGGPRELKHRTNDNDREGKRSTRRRG
jgi:hypothetical protein